LVSCLLVPDARERDTTVSIPPSYSSSSLPCKRNIPVSKTSLFELLSRTPTRTRLYRQHRVVPPPSEERKGINLSREPSFIFRLSCYAGL
jgi:hypothetical protein